MNKSTRRKILLLLGDWGSLYLALFLMVASRYGADWQVQWLKHLRPFTLIFPIWLAVIYGTYLYESHFLRPSLDALRALGAAVAIAAVGSITAFYLFPPGLIHPRRNLLFFAVFAGALLALWRFSFYRLTRKALQTNLLFLGGGREVNELVAYFEANPELRYRNRGVIQRVPEELTEILTRVRKNQIGLVVVKSPKGEGHFVKSIFPLLSSGVTVIELEEFYERTLGKVSPEMLDDIWFVRNLEDINLEVYKLTKRLLDILTGILGTIATVLFFLPIALAIKLDSKGPVLFKQERVGQGNKLITIYKFRTMHSLGADGSAETTGAKWTTKDDRRVTNVGRFLRTARLDELPQFWNILRGDLSFVGPRPERSEFVKELTRKIPYYSMRHLVKPGLTGWAQVNYDYGASIEDARTKLQYDIYYAKKRSLILDLAILLKTTKLILTRQGR